MASLENTVPLDAGTEALNQWANTTALRRTGREASPRTERSRASRLRSLAKVLGTDSLNEIAAVLEDRKAVEALMDALWAQYSPGSVRALVDTLAVLGRYAIGQGWILRCELEQGDRPAPTQKPITVYAQDDVDILIRLARNDDLRWWAFLCFMSDTGRRVSEALSLEWTWLGQDPPNFHLPTTKNGRQQYVPLSDRLAYEVFTAGHIERLQSLKPRRHEAFHRSQRTYVFPWAYVTVQKRFARDCKRIGMEYRGLHCFRHTAATRLLADGVPIQAVAALLGHSTVATTDRTYSHVTALDFARYVR